MNSQDSLTDQLLRVVKLAEQAGEYDAADWIKGRMTDPDNLTFEGGKIPREWWGI